MRFRVMDASDPDGLSAWSALWRAWPRREVMAHPEYARLFARPEDRVVCACGESPGRTVLFPLLLRPLAAEPWARPGETRWDATTPYGYGGPFTWGDDPPEDAAFWAAFAAWCRDAGVVSTFARLSLFPEELAAVPGGVAERQRNVVVPLDGGPEALWRGYETKVRRWIRTAEQAGLTVEVDRTGARLDAFLAIYEHTMQRCGADAWYFFPRAFFERIVEGMAGHFAFFFTLAGGEPVSSDLVLCSAEHVCYFLGGTREDAFALGPNYLLKHHVATWAIAEGKRAYVLGGGYEPRDGLYRYKRGFARHGEVPFRVACLVHDDSAYRELVARRAERSRADGAAWSPRPEFFPSYRA